MIYSVLIRNSKGKFKRQPSTDQGVELKLHADKSKNDEGFHKKLFLKYWVNAQGEQVVELFGSEAVIIKCSDYQIITSEKVK